VAEIIRDERGSDERNQLDLGEKRLGVFEVRVGETKRAVEAASNSSPSASRPRKKRSHASPLGGDGGSTNAMTR
jgi:hypothetical protein